MKWQGRRGSDNIEDRREAGPAGGRRVSLGGAGGLGLVALVLVGWLFGVDLTPLLNSDGLQRESAPRVEDSGSLSERDRAMGDFVSVTLADTEEIWADIFRKDLGKVYHPAVLVLFSQATPSPCGTASGATGPFYCPVDGKVYLDTAFFETLSQELAAGGDFAAAYVVAHEIGHRVQDELGILDKVEAARAKATPAVSNALSVRLELQADCFAGVWAQHAAEDFGTIERGDVAEAMNAAAQIGDDTLARNAGRRPMPDSFTHGTSDQRQFWFAQGFDSGAIGACDTFARKTP
ncbi:KPN_02809 family neutral zinc metallopeptidase [Rhodobacter capsulatus]|uniref:KPN_02809 family neutral zinc metallopeptidase n=1 Tax=Rhodobacter capsulatus TaxID=1061 RepID=UPI004028854B